MLACAASPPVWAVAENDKILSLNLGVLPPTGETRAAMGNSAFFSLSGDYWLADYFGLSLEMQQVMGHKISASRDALYRTDPIFNIERYYDEVNSFLRKANQGYEIFQGLAGSLKQTAFFFAPGIKFGRTSEGARSIVRTYGSLAFGLYHTVLSGSLTAKGQFADGSRFSVTRNIDRKIRDDFGVSVGIGFTTRGMDGRLVFGLDLRYYRVMKDGLSPDSFLSPSIRVGYKW